MIGNDDELNILHSQTYRTVTVEGDRGVSLRLPPFLAECPFLVRGTNN